MNKTPPLLKRHYPGLDGLRALAILAVIAVHTKMVVPKALAAEPTAFYNWFYRIVNIGWAGVDLFFVLSGFLITGILLETRTKKGYYKSFFARRFLRIFPIYYLFLALLFLGIWLFRWDLDWYRWLFEHQFYYWLYLQNWLVFKSDGLFPGWDLVSHFWSLAVEEQFYLFWPFVVAALNRKRLLAISLCLAVTIPVFRGMIGYKLLLPQLFGENVTPFRMYFLTPFRLDTLAIGSALACLLHSPTPVLQKYRYAGRFLALASVTLLLSILFIDSWSSTSVPMQAFGFTGLALLSAVAISEIVVADGEKSWLTRVFSQQWMRAIGKYSYAMYIFHLPIFFVIRRVFDKAGYIPYQPIDHQGIYNSSTSVLALFGGIFMLNTLLSFLAAYISWHCFEKFFLKWKKRFPRPE